MYSRTCDASTWNPPQLRHGENLLSPEQDSSDHLCFQRFQLLKAAVEERLKKSARAHNQLLEAYKATTRDFRNGLQRIIADYYVTDILVTPTLFPNIIVVVMRIMNTKNVPRI